MSLPETGPVPGVAPTDRLSKPSADWENGHRAGRTETLREVQRYVLDRRAEAGRFDDTRPYEDLLSHLADKIRGITS